MSEPTGGMSEREPGRRPGALSALAGALAGVLAFLVIVVAVLLLGGNGEDLDVPEAAGTPATAEEEDEEAEETPTPTPTPTATPTPTPTPTPGEREPTDADAAAFASSYQPPGARDVESVTVDVTGDDRPEIVVTSIANGVTRVDVAQWDGEAYEVVFTDQGGEAEEIDWFTVRDVTGDGVREIVTIQHVGQSRESLSLWGWDGESFVRMEADGGCWDGSHTYGVIGAGFRDDELVATCDGTPRPTAEWPSDVYVWDGEAWTYDRTETP